MYGQDNSTGKGQGTEGQDDLSRWGQGISSKSNSTLYGQGKAEYKKRVTEAKGYDNGASTGKTHGMKDKGNSTRREQTRSNSLQGTTRWKE